MAIKKQLKNPLVQQYVLEIALPLAGYFFFDWSLAIIAAFYLLDFFSAEIARNRRVYKVFKSTGSAKVDRFMISLFVGGLFFFVSLYWTWENLILMTDGEEGLIALHEELKAFAREELWLLVPIVLFVYHLKDVMTFYMPRRYMKYNYEKMVKFHLIELLILTTLILIGVFCWRYFQLADLTVLIGFIVVKLGFDILIARSLDARYNGAV